MIVDIEPQVEGIVAKSPGLEMRLGFGVDIRGLGCDTLQHTRRGEEKDELQGLGLGKLVCDEFAVGQIMLTRHVFVPDETDGMAVRLTVKHERSEPLEVSALTPVVAKGPASLRLGCAEAPDWIVLREPRYKNDLPAATRLGIGELAYRIGRQLDG